VSSDGTTILFGLPVETDDETAAWCARADVLEFERLATTIAAWWPKVLGFLQTGITHAGTETTNRTVKTTARTAYGFRNLDNQRRRVGFTALGNADRRRLLPAVLVGGDAYVGAGGNGDRAADRQHAGGRHTRVVEHGVWGLLVPLAMQRPSPTRSNACSWTLRFVRPWAKPAGNEFTTTSRSPRR